MLDNLKICYIFCMIQMWIMTTASTVDEWETLIATLLHQHSISILQSNIYVLSSPAIFRYDTYKSDTVCQVCRFVILSFVMKVLLEQWWSGTTLTIKYGPHIFDLHPWIGALLHFLCDTKQFRKSQIGAFWSQIWPGWPDLWFCADLWLFHITQMQWN